MAKGQTSRLLVWILLGLLIVGLAGFGATNFGGGTRSVGTVGDTEIDLNRYARDLQQELRAFSAETGRNVTLAEAQLLGIPQTVLGRIVALTALEDESATLGISVGDATVRQRILEIPSFRGVDGEFDRDAYGYVLDQSGLSVAEFEDRIRVETAAGILQDAVASGVSVPEVFTDTIYDYAREERDVTWAQLGSDALADDPGEPSEADLTAYHEANPEPFTRPETKVITYAWLTPEMLIDTVEPDEDALRALYEDRIEEFVQPERRLVERLVFATEEAAQEAKARIDAGETTFDDLVAERGLTLDDVDLGDLGRDDLGAAGEDVFALTEPGVVGPLDSTLGPALFRMNAILAAQEVSFEEAREELVIDAAADRARRIIADNFGHYEDQLAGGATLEELADETELELGAIEWTPGTSEGIAAYEGFREAAAAVKEGDFPEVFELEEGGVFAIRLDELRPEAIRPFEEARTDVAAAWTSAEWSRLLAGEAEEIASELRNGREMASLRLPLGTDRGLSRDSFVEASPPGFVSRVFEMEEGEVAVISGPESAWIVRLDAVRLPDGADAEALVLKRLFGDQASQGLADDLLNAFSQALQQRKGIEINQSAINAVHAQFP